MYNYLKVPSSFRLHPNNEKYYDMNALKISLSFNIFFSNFHCLLLVQLFHHQSSVFGYQFESNHQFCEHFQLSATSVHQVHRFHVLAFAPASITARSPAYNRTHGYHLLCTLSWHLEYGCVSYTPLPSPGLSMQLQVGLISCAAVTRGKKPLPLLVEYIESR